MRKSVVPILVLVCIVQTLLCAFICVMYLNEVFAGRTKEAELQKVINFQKIELGDYYTVNFNLKEELDSLRRAFEDRARKEARAELLRNQKENFVGDKFFDK